MTQSRFSRPQLAALPLLSLATLPHTAQAQTTSVFSYTGANQSFTVPDDVNNLTVKLWGAGGANSGGSAAFVTGILAVTPGSVLTLIVGGGGNFSGSAFGGGAFWGGGGRSAIRDSTNLELVTAGAGGGAAGGPGTLRGGSGGLATGSNGGGPGGGGGGTQSAGGFGGAGAA